MFEPIHGSAPDIADQDIANLIGAIWSGALMLEHLGEPKAAEAIVKAIEETTRQGRHTKDLGGTAKTTEIDEQIVQNLKTL